MIDECTQVALLAAQLAAAAQARDLATNKKSTGIFDAIHFIDEAERLLIAVRQRRGVPTPWLTRSGVE